jgi:HD-GYP domain-containing protein (c-di-GMP phosphodiesterase class II)
MSDTRVLLGKITELRQRLAQVQGLVGEASRTAAALLGGDAPETADAPLDARIADGERRQALLDASLRQLADGMAGNEIRPTRLIGRARHLLERGRDIVARLRHLADEPLLIKGDAISDDSPDDPLLQSFRGTAAMTESALRLVQAFPDAPSAQLRLSDGLDNILSSIQDRSEGLAYAVGLRKSDIHRRDTLAELYQRLRNNETTEPEPLLEIAEGLVAEVREAAPMRLSHAYPKHAAEFVASHSLNVARVAARIIKHDPDWQRYTLDTVVAALLKDVGMLSVHPEILASDEPLTDDHRRAIELHPRTGGEWIAKYMPAAAPLCEAIVSHHERLDGTGYPAGLKDMQIGALPRLLAVADVYAALCGPRPHRPAQDPRAALTETLLLADRGLLDRNLAERMLHLSFYPVGSVVELADGRVGVVVATHLLPRQLHTPARPVVAVLADAEGRTFPSPRHVDLAECEGKTIVRALTQPQRRTLLGRRYPELV